MSATAEFPASFPGRGPWLGRRLTRAGDRIAGAAVVLAAALAIAGALYATWALPVLWLVRSATALP
jgi:hypothetical protein